MFFKVPVSSWALACPAQKAAASARPIIRKCFIVLPLLDGGGNACINRAGIECNFRPRYDPRTTGIALLSRPRPVHLAQIPEHTRHDAKRLLADRQENVFVGSVLGAAWIGMRHPDRGQAKRIGKHVV